MTIDTLVIVVYNRLDNLKKWFHILSKCCMTSLKVVVIHNVDDDKPRGDREYLDLCDKNNAYYIPRKNVGYDIGAFQDVCKDRLCFFPSWSTLLWCTDDVFPTTKDFISYFVLEPEEGVRCMEVSPYVRSHIRTTGFSINKGTARRLKFPADPVVTKQQCYLFEHRSGGKTFKAQIEDMGLEVMQVAPRETSPLFDTGYHRRLNREAELETTWGIPFVEKQPAPAGPLVEIICPIYKSFPAVISSLIMQTYQNWKLKLIHDGPHDGSVEAYVNLLNDPRISFEATETNRGSWGHSIRSEWLQKSEGVYTVITNPDNQYMPVFLEKTVRALQKNKQASAAYCSKMVHSYKQWEVIACRPARGYVDCGGVLLRTAMAQQAGWLDVTSHSADWFFFDRIVNIFGINNFIPVEGCLFVHN